MTTSAGPVALYDLVSVTRETSRESETFSGQPVGGPYGRIFGGQLIGQATSAASGTVNHDRVAHSLHAYFPRAGRSDLPVEYEVERVRDGGFFSVRSVTARQGDRVLLRAALSFQRPREGLEHQSEHPVGYPDPDEVAGEDVDEALASDGTRPEHRRFVELRRIPRTLDPGASTTAQAVWMRAARRGGDRSAAVGRAAMAMATDYTVLETVLKSHGLSFRTPGLSIASLDHSLWWHAEGDLDDWLLYVQESPWSGGERGLVSGRIYSRDGRLLASIMQEGLLRLAATHEEVG
ncbi:acyl-CoA thioesterase II [Cnuibacter physcomitrellae]|uniref:Uncharacterized protein n=1 Tax=Cnuibacter physcomitrellae TaxID=1619308 RepID=A0A1X9LT66_9MICO|nr:acyl-CoA thioesterase domain-containing protein [Cnuibacter physcomitrellae]ARJ07518.1 hypothetical protein B5808_19135 [Cnuibacter physcomitrellae]GGI42534.1 acyl-CoA thioesterase II [Cnuibacter physcomitrellae]